MIHAGLNQNQIREQAVDPVVCRAMWCAVIQEQLRLARSSSYYDVPADVAAARRWFGTRDFRLCCDLAGVHHERILRGVLRLITPEVS